MYKQQPVKRTHKWSAILTLIAFTSMQVLPMPRSLYAADIQATNPDSSLVPTTDPLTSQNTTAQPLNVTQQAENTQEFLMKTSPLSPATPEANQQDTSVAMSAPSGMENSLMPLSNFISNPIALEKKTIDIQLIQVCDDTGTNCANPERNYFEEETKLTWAQAGIDVNFLDWQTISSEKFMNLSVNDQDQGYYGNLLNEAKGKGPESALKVFFVDTISSGARGLTFGVGTEIGMAIAKEAFNQNTVLTLAHEIGNALGLKDNDPDLQNIMHSPTPSNLSKDEIGVSTGKLTQDQIDASRNQIDLIKNGLQSARNFYAFDAPAPGTTIEAESGVLNGNYQIVNGSIFGTSTGSWDATYTYNVASDDQYVLVLTTDYVSSYDRYIVTVDGVVVANYNFHTDPSPTGFDERYVTFGDNIFLPMTAGVHSVKISGFSPNVKLDKIRLARFRDLFQNDPVPTDVLPGYVGVTEYALGFDQPNTGTWWPKSNKDGFTGSIRPNLTKIEGMVDLPGILKAGTYNVFVKTDAGRDIQATVGGLTSDKITTSGTWTKIGPLTLTQDDHQVLLSFYRSPGSLITSTENFSAYGLYITDNLNETIMSGDVAVDLRYPTQMDNSDPVKGNLVSNSSFETGVDSSWGFLSGKKVDLDSIVDTTVGHTGSSSIKLPLDSATGWMQFSSRVYHLDPNKKYTFSFWVKADPAHPVPANNLYLKMMNTFVPEKGDPYGQQMTISKNQTSIDGQWQRMSVTGFSVAYPTSDYRFLIEMNSGRTFSSSDFLWIDDVQLEEGDLTNYLPSQAVETQLSMPVPSGIYFEDEPIVANLKAYNNTSLSQAKSMHFEVYDYLNRKVKEGTVDLSLNGNTGQSSNLDLTTGARGSFRVVYWVDGVEGSEKEQVFSIVPRPEVSGVDPTSYMGIHASLYDFQMDSLERLGMKWTRSLSPDASFRMTNAAPTDPRNPLDLKGPLDTSKFVWFDDKIQMAVDKGLSILGTLTGGTIYSGDTILSKYGPIWAKQANGLLDLDLWQKYVQIIVDHYKGSVHAWEVWNEPNQAEGGDPLFTDAYYADLLRRTVTAIEAADPTATIVGMGGTDLGFMQRITNLIESQTPGWMQAHVDVFSTHAYTGGNRVTDFTVPIVQNMNMPVWNTETGQWDLGMYQGDQANFLSYGRNITPSKDSERFGKGMLLKPEALVQNFIESIGNGETKYFYYDSRVYSSLDSFSTHPTIFDYDGTVKPKGIAYAIAGHFIDHSTSLGAMTLDPNISSYLFEKNGVPTLTLWSSDQVNRKITTGLSPTQYTVYDLMGNEIPLGADGVIELGRTPIYVVGKNITTAAFKAAIQAGVVAVRSDTIAPHLTISDAPREPTVRNDVRIRWIAMDETSVPQQGATDNPEAKTPDQPKSLAILYQYRLVGKDAAWSMWTPETFHDYKDLAPGTYSFEVKAQDEAGNISDTVTRTVTILGVTGNQVPTVSAQTVSLTEDGQSVITLSGTDPDGGTLTYIIMGNPTHGTLVKDLSDPNGATYIYTPNANYNGSDSFTFKANDGTSDSSLATITLNVSAVNDVPVATFSTLVGVSEDIAKSFVLTGSDADLNPLTYSIVTLPTHGTLNCTGANCSYTSAADYNGPDSFTYKVNDGTVDSTPVTVNFTVTAVNDAPTATTIAAQTINEDAATSALAFTIGDVDTALGSLVVTASSTNTTLIPNGNIVLGGTGANRTITITPAANQNGSAMITLIIFDGVAQTIQTFNVTVTPVNDAPTVTTIAAQTINEDAATSALAFTIGDIDTALGSLTVTATSSNLALIPNANIVLGGTGANRTVTVTPAANQNGSAVITLDIFDGSAHTLQTFNVDVTAVNDAPTATAIAAQTINEDAATSALAFTIGDIDTAIGSLTVTATSSNTTLIPSTNIVLGGTGANRTVTVTPAANQNGSAVITLDIFDGAAHTLQTFNVNVTAVNDAPTATTIAAQTINEDAATSALAFTIGDIDTALGSLTVTATSSNLALIPNSNIVLGGTGANRTVTVTPAANQNGSAVITLDIFDGSAHTLQTFNVTVNPVNDAPTATAIAAQTINEDTATSALAFTIGDIDTALGSLTVTATSSNQALIPDANLVLGGTGANRTVTVTPLANQNGSAVITLDIFDGTAHTLQTFNVTVNAVNDAPTATAIAAQTINEDTATSALAFTIGDIDTALGSLTITATSSNLALIPNGNIVLGGTGANRTVTVTPLANQNGSAVITLDIFDGSAHTLQTFNVNVTAVNDAPTVTTISAQTINEDAATSALAFTIGDIDTALGSLTVTATSSNTALIPDANIVLGGTGANRTVTVTPLANQNGSAIITLDIFDGSAHTMQKFNVNVTAVNDVPLATFASLIGVSEDLAKTFTLTGSDVEGSALTYTIVVPTTHGTLNCTGANCTYTSALDYNGSDSFTYKVNDGSADSIPVTVNFLVAAVNDAPVATFSTLVGVSEDVTKSFVLTGSDVDGNPLTYSIVTPAAHGTVSCTGANCTYVSAANYNGPDSFTYKVNDGTVDSTPITVNFNVAAVNDAPVATLTTLSSVSEDTDKAFALTGSDVEGDPLTYLIVTPAAHGTVNCTAGNCTYTPAANYNGPDSFSYKVNDGNSDSVPVTVSFNVAAVNDAPFATFTSLLGVSEDIAKTFSLTGMDIEGSALIYSILITTTHGTLNCSGANCSYTSDPGYNGLDSFTYKVSDGALDSALTTVNFRVAAVNDAPVVTAPALINGTEDTALSGDLSASASDPDSDPLTFILASSPSKGVLVLNADGTYSYTPNANANGTDSFTYKVSDGNLDSNVVTAYINLAAVNDAPIATLTSLSGVSEDTTKSFVLSASDVDGNPLSYIVVNNPAHGTLSCVGANCSYAPEANYNGADSFTYKVNDGTVDSDPVTLNFNVESVNDAPVGTFAALNGVSEDVSNSFVLTGTDVDGDALSYSVVQPLHGVLNCDGTDCTYVPASNYNGPDSFTYRVNDGKVFSNPVTVNFNVASVNDAPVLAGIPNQVVNENDLLVMSPAAFDVDHDALTFSAEGLPAGAEINSLTGVLRWKPDFDQSGSYDIKIKVSDGSLSVEQTVNIDVRNTNRVPLAQGIDQPATEDVVQNITLKGTDPDGEALTYEIVKQPLHGKLDCTNESCTYTPEANFNGKDNFLYRVSDGKDFSKEAEVLLNVAAVNDAPVAEVMSVDAVEDTAQRFTLKVSDVDLDPLSSVITKQPAHGTIDCKGIDCVYQPESNFNGTDSFEFYVTDGNLQSATIQVPLNVQAVNDRPVITSLTNESGVITEAGSQQALGDEIVIHWTTADVEGQDVTMSVEGFPTDSIYRVDQGKKEFGWSLPPIEGTYDLKFTANDGEADSEMMTIRVNVVKQEVVDADGNRVTNYFVGMSDVTQLLKQKSTAVQATSTFAMTTVLRVDTKPVVRQELPDLFASGSTSKTVDLIKIFSQADSLFNNGTKLYEYETYWINYEKEERNRKVKKGFDLAVDGTAQPATKEELLLAAPGGVGVNPFAAGSLEAIDSKNLMNQNLLLVANAKITQQKMEEVKVEESKKVLEQAVDVVSNMHNRENKIREILSRNENRRSSRS